MWKLRLWWCFRAFLHHSISSRAERTNLVAHMFTIFFFLMFIYLAALGLGCSIWDLHCVMQDVSLQCSGSLIVVSGLRACRLSWGTWLSCSMACRILVPWPGIEPASSALHSGFLTTGPPEKSHMYTIHGALEGELELNRVKYLA